MASPLRVLISSAGRRVALLECFRSAAAGLGIEIEILACDQRPDRSAACHSADAAFAVPAASDPDFAASVLDICRSRGVALVVPTIDPELLPLSLSRDVFEAAGCTVAVSAPELIRTARDKLATAQFLEASGIPSPRTRSAAVVLASPADWRWPTFVKPQHGSAGRGVRAVDGPDDIDAGTEPMVVQDLLRGSEYTVNLYFDRAGRMRCAVPHERLQVRAGEVEKGITRRNPALIDLAHQLAAALPGPRGALCFQAMINDDGKPSVFEINARFGGGYPLADHAGAKFARWLIEETLGLPTTANDEWHAGVTMLRYDAAVFASP